MCHLPWYKSYVQWEKTETLLLSMSYISLFVTRKWWLQVMHPTTEIVFFSHTNFSLYYKCFACYIWLWYLLKCNTVHNIDEIQHQPTVNTQQFILIGLELFVFNKDVQKCWSWVFFFFFYIPNGEELNLSPEHVLFRGQNLIVLNQLYIQSEYYICIFSHSSATHCYFMCMESFHVAGMMWIQYGSQAAWWTKTFCVRRQANLYNAMFSNVKPIRAQLKSCFTYPNEWAQLFSLTGFLPKQEVDFIHPQAWTKDTPTHSKANMFV